MAPTGEAGSGSLVIELTAKLNDLRASKGEDLTTDLQRRLALLLQPQHSSSSASSPVLSPDVLGTSPTFHGTDVLSEALVAALQREKGVQRENLELRSAFRRESHRNDLWRGELRRRCGISIEELAELESADQGGSNSSSPRRRPSQPSLSSTSSAYSSVSSILIPGSSSSSSSFLRRSRNSSTSTGTQGTTPSTSYPTTGAPHPTPLNSSPNTIPSPSALFRAFSQLVDDDLLPSPPPADTPLSISPGSRSRSGSLSRRASAFGIDSGSLLQRSRGASVGAVGAG